MGYLKEQESQAAAPAEAAPEEEAAPKSEAAPAEQSAEATPRAASDWPSTLPEPQQDQLEQALGFLHQILYKNPQATQGVLKQLQDDGSEGAAGKSVALVALTLVQQISEKLKLEPQVVAYLVPATVSRVLEIATQVKKMKVTPDDVTLAFATATQQGGQQPQPGAAQPAAPATAAPPAVA